MKRTTKVANEEEDEEWWTKGRISFRGKHTESRVKRRGWIRDPTKFAYKKGLSEKLKKVVGEGKCKKRKVRTLREVELAKRNVEGKGGWGGGEGFVSELGKKLVEKKDTPGREQSPSKIIGR